MKDERFLFTSLTRITQLAEQAFEVRRLAREHWEEGDYMVGRVENRPGHSHIELCNGRMMEVMEGDLLVGAVGNRHATMEATGMWEDIRADGKMNLLTGAGLFAKMSSRSMFLPQLMDLSYQGHVFLNGEKCSMDDYVPEVPEKTFNTPTILMAGTSMSAGKTTAARIITRQLRMAGLEVLGAKLSGAGRYRDILTIADAGASHIFDFVDVGLPSTIHDRQDYHKRLKTLLSMMASVDADVAVVEIGASPLEPYNGDIAIQEIRESIRCVGLCASDPYAVYGVMKAFELHPDFVTGLATNTIAGIELITKLCRVKALNLIDPNSLPGLRQIIGQNLGLDLEKSRHFV